MENNNKPIEEQRRDDLYVGILSLITSGMFVLATVVSIESGNVPVSVVTGLTAGFLVTGALIRLGRRVRDNYGK